MLTLACWADLLLVEITLLSFGVKSQGNSSSGWEQLRRGSEQKTSRRITDEADMVFKASKEERGCLLV